MSGATTDEPMVVDDLPAVLPVTRPELEVIETYLGGLIDRLLADGGSAATPSPISNPGMPIRGSRPRS
jgi:hypothetical protein